jgi:hypothetical protein
LENIDAQWSDTHLEDGFRLVVEVGGAETGERTAKIREGVKDGQAVLRVGTDENVAIFGGSAWTPKAYPPTRRYLA